VQPIRIPRRSLRHAVWVALFAWVFALAAGVANACIVAVPGSAPPGHEKHRHTHAAHESVDHSFARAEPADHGSLADLDHENEAGLAHDDPGKAGCLKFCDDESTAWSKNGDSGFDQMPAHLAGLGFRIQAASVTDAVGRLSLERPGTQGPPLVIRLLRLTL
jgi:hypothetical protein